MRMGSQVATKFSDMGFPFNACGGFREAVLSYPPHVAGALISILVETGCVKLISIVICECYKHNYVTLADSPLPEQG